MHRTTKDTYNKKDTCVHLVAKFVDFSRLRLRAVKAYRAEIRPQVTFPLARAFGKPAVTGSRKKLNSEDSAIIVHVMVEGRIHQHGAPSVS